MPSFDGLVVSSMQVLCASYTDEEFFKFKCSGNVTSSVKTYWITLKIMW